MGWEVGGSLWSQVHSMVVFIHRESGILNSAVRKDNTPVFWATGQAQWRGLAQTPFLVITARPYTLESDGDRSVCNLRACLTLQLAHLVMWQILLLKTWIGSPVLLIACMKCAERETNCSSAEIHAGGLIIVQLELHLWKDVRDPETHTDVKERRAKNISASKSFFECFES